MAVVPTTKRAPAAPRLPTPSQAERAADSGRASSSLVPLRLDCFVANEIPELVDLVDEFLGLEDAGVVLVELRVNDGLDAAGPRRHHRDAVGQIDRPLHGIGG